MPVPNFKQSLILEGHLGRVNVVQYNNKDNILHERIASGGNDGKVRIWNPVTGACIHVVEAHGAPVTTLSWSPTGTVEAADANNINPTMKIVTGSEDRTVKVWDVVTGKELAKFDVGAVVRSVSWRPTGDLVACGDAEGRLTLWQFSSGLFFQRPFIVDNKRSVNSVVWTADGKYVIFGSDDGKLYEYSVAEKESKELYDLKFPVRTVTCSDAGSDEYIVAASINEEGPNIVIWEKNEYPYPGQVLNISTCVDVTRKKTSPGFYTLSSTLNGVNVYDGDDDFSPDADLYPVDRGVLSVSWDTRGDNFAAGCVDGTVRIFELNDAPQIRRVIARPISRESPLSTSGERKTGERETTADLSSAILDIIGNDITIRNNIVQILQNDERFGPEGDSPTIDTNAIEENIKNKIMNEIKNNLKDEVVNMIKKLETDMEKKINDLAGEKKKVADIIQQLKKDMEKIKDLVGENDKVADVIKQLKDGMENKIEELIKERDKQNGELKNEVIDKIQDEVAYVIYNLEIELKREWDTKQTALEKEIDDAIIYAINRLKDDMENRIKDLKKINKDELLVELFGTLSEMRKGLTFGDIGRDIQNKESGINAELKEKMKERRDNKPKKEKGEEERMEEKLEKNQNSMKKKMKKKINEKRGIQKDSLIGVDLLFRNVRLRF